MATNTPKLNLIKPDFVDVVDVSDLNSNMDILDDAITTAPSVANLTDTDITTPAANELLQYDGSDWVNVGQADAGAIPVFADAAARTTAIPSPSEGMVTYRSDDDVVEVYTTAWGAVGIDPGIQHIHTESFTGVASVSLDNVFSATYQNYRIIITELTGSSNSEFQIRFRAASSDTSANYRYINYGGRTSGADFFDAGNGNNAMRLGRTTTTTGQNKISVDIFEPFAAKITGAWGGSFGGDASTYFGVQVGGAQTDSTSFDGLTLFATAGNITGKVSVYGYLEA